MMNDEFKIIGFSFIIHHSVFIISSAIFSRRFVDIRVLSNHETSFNKNQAAFLVNDIYYCECCKCLEQIRFACTSQYRGAVATCSSGY